MPKLLIFVPCEKVILGQGDNSVSLIVVMRQIKFQGIFPGKEIPPGAGAFARMAVFSQWYASPAEIGKTFEQRLTLTRTGDSKPTLEAINGFQIPEKITRVIANIEVMPILQAGEYEFTASLREKGETDWPEPVGKYPVDIVHEIQFQPQT